MQGNRSEVQSTFPMLFVCLHQCVHRTTQLSATSAQATERLSQRKMEAMRWTRSKNNNKKIPSSPQYEIYKVLLSCARMLFFFFKKKRTEGRKAAECSAECCRRVRGSTLLPILPHNVFKGVGETPLI